MESVVRERFMGNQSQPAVERASLCPKQSGRCRRTGVGRLLLVRQADEVANFMGEREKINRRGVRALQVQKAPNNPHTE